MIYDSLDWDIGVTIPAFSRNPSEATQTTMGPESPNLGRLDFCMLGKWIQRNCLGNSEVFGEKYIIQRCWIHWILRLLNFRTSSTLLTLMKVDRWTWRSFSRRAFGNLLDFYQTPPLLPPWVVFPCKEILFLETDSEASDVFWWYFNDV